MKRWLFFVYGVGCHLLFLAIFVALAGFVGNFLVPKSIDSPDSGGRSAAVAVDLLLIGLFAAQHSIMARPWFKRIWTRVIPEQIERSTYVLASCIVTVVLMQQWRGLDAVVWNVEQPAVRAALWGLFAFGWLMVPTVTLMIHHFDLLGTRQVWLHLQNQPYSPLPFRTPMLYRFIRHPLYVGWAIAFWAAPTMTVGHALFAGAMSFYMVAATFVEERDLIAHFGADYRAYQRSVPKFIPQLRSTDATDASLSVD